MNVARLNLMRTATTHTHRPASSAEPSQAEASPDQVEFSGTPALRQKLGSMGFLESFGSLPAPFGSVLDLATRRELEAALQGLESKGATFSTKKTGILSHFGSDTKQLPAREVLSALESQIQDQDQRPSLEVKTPWHDSVHVQNFNEILAMKEVADGQGGALLEAAQSLQKTGLVSNPERVVTNIRSGSASYIMLERARSYDHPEPERVDTEDGLFFIDYIEGSGKDRGLDEPEVAAGIRELYKEHRLSRDYAFRLYAEKKDYAQLGGDRRQPSMLVAREHLKDPAKVLEASEAYRTTYRYEVAPALARAGNAEIPEEVRKTDGKFPMTTRLQAFAGIMEASSPLNVQDHKVRADVHGVYSELVKTSETEAQLFTRLQALSPTLGSEGPEAAQQLLTQLAASKSPLAMGPREKAFEQLRQDTGSLSLAKAGVNMVRIPLAGESLDDRVELYTKIAEQLPAESRHLTPEFYQEALIGRDQARSLADNGKRFSTILGACTNLKQPGLAPAVYHTLHQRAREGADLELALEDFVKASVTGKSVAEALTYVARTLEPGAIEFLEDSVQVGDFNLDFS